MNDVGAIIRELALRLIEQDVPIDRVSAHFGILHPRYVGVSRIWTPEDGLSMSRPEHSDTAQDLQSSPFEYVRTRNDWLEVRIDRDSSAPFRVLNELRRAGFTHYLMAPLRFSDGSIQGASFATRYPLGFSRAETDLLRALAGPLAIVVELKRLRIMSASMLAEYVGSDPAERILSGTVQRGDLVHIPAALMFTDLVGFTAMTQRESAESVVETLNHYFEAVDAAVTAKGGEILKFVGDGVFAIFPEGEAGPAERALDAARQVLATSPSPLRIALHQGVIAYGNVGSGARLDFTAVGPDVNLLNRLEGVARSEGRDLVMSRAIAEALPGECVFLGAHATRGFEEPIDVFVPNPAAPRH